MEPKEGVYISPAYEAVVEHDHFIECGSGPEYARADTLDNPNWLRNRAANCIALAEWLEGAEQRRAEEVRRLAKRRDELARQLDNLAHDTDASRLTYHSAKPTLKVAIDRIIELEPTP